MAGDGSLLVVPLATRACANDFLSQSVTTPSFLSGLVDLGIVLIVTPGSALGYYQNNPSGPLKSLRNLDLVTNLYMYIIHNNGHHYTNYQLDLHVIEQIYSHSVRV